MWFYKNLSYLCLCFLLTACGFRPLYMSQEESSGLSYPIKIASIPNRDGQLLRNYLVELLTPAGPPLKPKYILEIKLTDSITGIGVNKDETTSRKQAILVANIILKDYKNNKVVYTHSTNAINSFSVLSQNYYADLVAEKDAKHEAIRLLAEKIKLLLATYIDTLNEN